MPSSSAAVETGITHEHSLAPTPEMPLPIGAGAHHAVAANYLLQQADVLAAQGDVLMSEVASQAAAGSMERHHILLEEIRSDLRGLGDQGRSWANKYLAHYFTGDPQAVGYESWVDWMADDKHGADDHALTTFLKRHAQEIARQQTSEEVQQAVRIAKEERVIRERQGMDQRWVSQTARETAHEVFDMKVVIGDLWDTFLKGREGYHYMRTDWVVIAQGQIPGKEGDAQLAARFRGALLNHETNHRRFDSKLPNLPHFEREAYADHLALAFEAEGKGVEVMDPDMREGSGLVDYGRYRRERALTASMLGDGWITIDPSAAMRAYTSGSEDSPEWREYNRLLDRSWGMHNFRARIDHKMHNYTEHLNREHPTWDIWQIQGQAAQWVQEDLQERRRDMQLLKPQLG